MKLLFKLSTLFILMGPVHANATDSRDQHPENHPAYQNDYDARRLQPGAANSEQPYYIKLLQIINSDTPVITIKASLNGKQLYL
jgi:hypothetical protein